MTNSYFQYKDPSLETQWRSLILFGKNSATYKFAFAKSLLELADKGISTISLSDLSIPYSKYMVEHIRNQDKQGSAKSSKFLDYCRSFSKGKISEEQLLIQTERLGFVNVIDAFQNVNGSVIENKFYEKNFSSGKKEIVITDHLLKLKESSQIESLPIEVEARWNLVETAWSLNINPALLEVNYDKETSLFYINDELKRTDVTSVRDALSGYQKGKCFYSFQDISINPDSSNLCDVDHFFPHVNKSLHLNEGVDINGVWNLVLSDSQINRFDKKTKIPKLKYLERLMTRNEYYIASKHPLAETIINQTGQTIESRRKFLQKQFDIATSFSSELWSPRIELPNFF